jgi:hypothetical protein
MPKVNNLLNNLFSQFEDAGPVAKKFYLNFQINEKDIVHYGTFECTVCFITYRLPPTKINRCLKCVAELWYLLVISTVVNLFSYAIVFFQHKHLWTRSSGIRQRMPDALGVVVRTVWSMRPILTSPMLAV